MITGNGKAITTLSLNISASDIVGILTKKELIIIDLQEQASVNV